MTTLQTRPSLPPLVDLLVDAGTRAELEAESLMWPSVTLTARQLCDLELLATGAFSPLTTFLGKADLESVCDRMRLADGRLWPIPVLLDVDDDIAATLTGARTLALRDAEGVMLAALHVTDVWQSRPAEEALAVFGTLDPTHPGVAAHLHDTRPWYVTGRLEVVTLPTHYDFLSLRHTPAELRAQFAANGYSNVVAFQTRNPMHRAHFELTRRAMAAADAHLLVHPVVGQTKPGDVDHYTRVRCYRGLMDSYEPGAATLSLLPLAMRMAGPREALWHALIRRNYGATHFIVGRDHAGPGTGRDGRPFYGPYDSQELVREHAAEVGIEMVPFRQMVYCPDTGEHLPDEAVPPGTRTLTLSGTQLRRRLAEGAELPDWFTPPAVARELRRRYPPRRQQGVTVFFTGLSGAGKSTVANVLCTLLLERGDRTVTLLDGDVVRQELSAGLGFSRQDRDRNIRRIGYVASEVTRHGGLAVCAPIAPYDATRRQVRRMVEQFGSFVLVHVSTSLEVCEARDRKGLYAKARAGLLPGFTGVSDPYEVPADADLTLDTSVLAADEAARAVLDHLVKLGFLDAAAPYPTAPDPAAPEPEV
jgi:sulfate adenylyltransferase